MPKTKPPALQVLFEPWPAAAQADRDGYEAFAGTYWIDALAPDGTFRDRGYRATVPGCTTCRRDSEDPRVHVPNINDMGAKRRRRCPQWKTVESIVRAFGGWKHAHYVELTEHEGLTWQGVPQRRRVSCPAPKCDRGSALKLVGMTDFERVTCGECRGSGWVAHAGPVRPDRHGMTEIQRRMRSSEAV